MASYAHIANGVIVELFSPPFGMEMADMFHSNIIWIDITGRNPQPQPGWTAVQQNGIWVMAPPVPITLTMTQQAQQALNSGVQIESFSTPSLNAVYAIDTEIRTDIMAEMLSLAANQAFTDGSQTIGWPDKNLNHHTFDPEHFRALATAIGLYVTALKQVISGVSTTLPNQPIKIL